MKVSLILTLILIIILSLVINISFNGTQNSLYGAEFNAPIEMIRAGQFTWFQYIEWIILLITHIMIFALPFLTGKRYFKLLLTCLPLLFIADYILYASVFIMVLLLPFIFVWIIALIIANQIKMVGD